jgi:hypothetical protein
LVLGPESWLLLRQQPDNLTNIIQLTLTPSLTHCLSVCLFVCLPVGVPVSSPPFTLSLAPFFTLSLHVSLCSRSMYIYIQYSELLEIKCVNFSINQSQKDTQANAKQNTHIHFTHTFFTENRSLSQSPALLSHSVSLPHCVTLCISHTLCLSHSLKLSPCLCFTRPLSRSLIFCVSQLPTLSLSHSLTL